ncbi:fimbria/pilus periplasmic chaperone [Citrobacter freundii]|uniref:fimbrial biogenesis chaperone n=1 Tax=Citrobacter portucalensis TaxID=1639133 RepID=UPI0015EA3158|nr:fimbria/pilus periplasmic chaperone [Citrobacter freundii]QMD58397.1 fimbria/pilus periplasmic chaperone [Citrobacter freundii]
MKSCTTNGIVAASLSLLLSSGTAAFASANDSNGGVGLGATRLVYHESDKQISLSLRNTSAQTPFLVQSFVLSSAQTKTEDFVVTPPLFLLKTQRENLIRIMYVGPELPKDRESLFYVSSRAIPSTEKNDGGTNQLKIAVQSVIKMFWRPDNLPISISNAPAALRCSYSGSDILVDNPSPYFITLTQMKVGTQALKNEMIAPKSQHTFKVPHQVTGKLMYRTINDYGAITEELECKS